MGWADLRQAMHEGRVVDAVLEGGGVDALDPQLRQSVDLIRPIHPPHRAEIQLVLLAVPVRILHCLRASAHHPTRQQTSLLPAPDGRPIAVFSSPVEALRLISSVPGSKSARIAMQWPPRSRDTGACQTFTSANTRLRRTLRLAMPAMGLSERHGRADYYASSADILSSRMASSAAQSATPRHKFK